MNFTKESKFYLIKSYLHFAKKIFSIKNAELLVLLSFSLIVIFWFHPNEAKGFWDVNPLYSPYNSLISSHYLWNPFLNAGSENLLGTLNYPVTLLYLLFFKLSGNSIYFEELLTWWIILLFSLFSMFFFISRVILVNDKGRLAGIIGTLIYNFNPYTAFTAWGDSAPNLPLVMAALPLFLLLMYYYFNSESKDKIVFIFLMALDSILLFSLIIVIIPVIFIILLFAIILSKSSKGLIKWLLQIIPISLIANSYWVFNILFNFYSGLSPVNFGTGAYYTILNIQQLSIHTPINITLRMLGENSLFQNWWTYSSLYINQLSPLVILMSIFPIICFSTLFLLDSLKRVRVISLSIISLTGILFSTGTSIGIIGTIYSFAVYHFALFQTANYQVPTWTLLTIFGFSGLSAIFIENLISKPHATSKKARSIFNKTRDNSINIHIRRVLVLSIIPLIILSSFPMFGGDILTNTYNTNYNVPPAYYTTSSYLNQKNGSFKVLVLPPTPTALTGLNWKGGVLIYNPLDQLTNKSLITNTIPGRNITNILFEIPGSGYYPTLFNCSARSLDDYYMLLKMNSVKYILIMKDTKYFSNYTFDANVSQLNIFISKIPSVIQSYTAQNISVYKVQNSTNSIYTSSDLLPGDILSRNILPYYASNGVVFSSPSNIGSGYVKYYSDYLQLNETLNKTVPFGYIEDAQQMNLSFAFQPSYLLIVGKGKYTSSVPLLLSSGKTYFLGKNAEIGIHGFNYTIIGFPTIKLLNNLDFTSINGTLDLYGIYVIYNMLSLDNLANISNLLPIISNHKANNLVPSFYQLNFSNMVEGIKNSSEPNTMLYSMDNITTITPIYIKSNITAQSGSSSIPELKYNMSAITLSSNKTSPWTDVVNLKALNLSIPKESFIVLESTNPVGAAIGSSSNFSTYSVVGISYYKYGSYWINEIQMPNNFQRLDHLWIFVQPYNRTTITSIDIVSITHYTFNVTLGNTAFFDGNVSCTKLYSPTDFRFEMISLPGLHLLVFSQCFSKYWVIKSITLDTYKFQKLVKHEVIDGYFNGYVFSSNNTSKDRFEIYYAPQHTSSKFIIASLISDPVLLTLSIFWFLRKKIRKKNYD